MVWYVHTPRKEPLLLEFSEPFSCQLVIKAYISISSNLPPTAELPDEDFAHIKRFFVWLYDAIGLDSGKVLLQRKMLFDSIIKELY